MAGLGLNLQQKVGGLVAAAIALISSASCSGDMVEMMEQDHSYILSYKGSIVVTDIPRRLEEGTEQKIKLRLSRAPEGRYRVTIASSHGNLLVDGKQKQTYSFDAHNYDQIKQITLSNLKDDNGLREDYAITIRSEDTGEQVYNIISLDKDLPFITRPSLNQGLDFPKGMALGDFDNDGKADLAIANKDLDTLALYRNLSSAAEVVFDHHGDLAKATSAKKQYFALAGDLDGDGDADIVDLVDDNSHDVDFYIAKNHFAQSGAFGFGTAEDMYPGEDHPSLDGPRFGAIEDVNGDGMQEILILDDDSGKIFFFDGQGNDLNKEIDIDGDGSNDQSPKSFVLKDFDGDGQRDFAVVQMNDGGVTFIPGVDLSAMSFSGERFTYALSGFPRDLAAGDIDGDGRPDLVATKYTGESFAIFHNMSRAGQFSFSKAMNIDAGSFPTIIELADLNGDGRPEVLVTNHGDDSLSLYINISTPGSIAFYEAVHLDTGQGPYHFAVADFNGDGLQDIVVANNEKDNTISVFQNDCPR